MRVSYSPESINDLLSVVEFVEPMNPFAARRIAIGLQEGIERPRQFPKIGLPVLKANDSEQIRDLYVGSYTVRYIVIDEFINILRVWHNKENEKNL